ncbi:hypothetical protein NPIL_469481 [Nephila pilipes]|uniref:Uncharacterized protein n=1 Tax=Nephila pilipes TaxID=299642 RepID=A0A8X6PLG2_NEPPI|nr:hypothetical protein NPIL_469481 [Nephila pilipes]
MQHQGKNLKYPSCPFTRPSLLIAWPIFPRKNFLSPKCLFRVPILRSRIKSGQVSGSGKKVKAAAVRLLMPWRFLYILRPLVLHVRKRDLRFLFHGCPIKVYK